MAIKIMCGNAGSGKTLSQVYEIVENMQNVTVYTNIDAKIKNCRMLLPEMIISKIPTKTKKTKNGEIEQIYEYDINLEFWKKAKKPLNIILDEAHNLIDSRNSSSKINRVFSSWQSAIRRICGEDDITDGDLTYITQIPYAIDVRSRELATEIKYHICYYIKECLECGYFYQENTEMPKRMKKCFNCDKQNFKKYGHLIKVFAFDSFLNFDKWKIDGKKTYFECYTLEDLHKYMKLYSTLQWENLFKGY
jgi:hypothetical protein